jgi:four helix bundle protein
MAGTTRETKVWQEAVGLAGDVVRVVRRATRRETKAFTDAMMLSAAAVATAIAEAPTRPTSAEERECYARARRSLVAVETQLAIARVSGIIPSTVHAQLAARVASLTQRVSNQMNHVERHNEKSPASSLPLLLEAAADSIPAR